MPSSPGQRAVSAVDSVCGLRVLPPLPHGRLAPLCPRCDEPTFRVLPPTARPRCGLPGLPVGFLSRRSIPGPHTSSRRSFFLRVVPQQVPFIVCPSPLGAGVASGPSSRAGSACGARHLSAKSPGVDRALGSLPVHPGAPSTGAVAVTVSLCAWRAGGAPGVPRVRQDRGGTGLPCGCGSHFRSPRAMEWGRAPTPAHRPPSPWSEASRPLVGCLSPHGWPRSVSGLSVSTSLLSAPGPRGWSESVT